MISQTSSTARGGPSNFLPGGFDASAIATDTNEDGTPQVWVAGMPASQPVPAVYTTFRKLSGWTSLATTGSALLVRAAVAAQQYPYSLICGYRSETTLKVAAIIAVGMLMTAATIGVATSARADVIYRFITPDGNIACSMGRRADGGHVACDIRDYTFRPIPCPTGPVNLVGDRFVLDQTSAEGSPAHLDCHSDTMVYPGQPVLDWGQKRDMGTGFGSMQCQSVPAGTFSPSMFCTDFPTTGHYFHIYRDHFDMG